MTTSEFLSQLIALLDKYESENDNNVAGLSVLPINSQEWLSWNGEKLIPEDPEEEQERW